MVVVNYYPPVTGSGTEFFEVRRLHVLFITLAVTTNIYLHYDTQEPVNTLR